MQFFLHPTTLSRARTKCKPVIDILKKFDLETASQCNICGSKRKAIIAEKDRYGFPARTALCLDCGLTYVMDRFTLDGYAKFYEKGIYRDLIAKFKGKPQTISNIRAAQVNYTKTIIRALDGFLPLGSNSKLLDVGGSTGLVAQEFVNRFNCLATVLDLASAEIAATETMGLKGIVGSIEDLDTTEEFDLILLCRTIEHLFDLKKALTKIRKLLRPNGFFYCDIADFPEICRREGPPDATTKIDHVFWLSQETAIPIFNSLGFELVTIIETLPPDQIGFLLRVGEPIALEPISQEWIDLLLRRFREIETDWYKYGQKPLDAQDWLKRKAYRIKRRLNGWHW